ncbi:MAG: DUF4350 domain-containing protein [Planctomycetales bacterium]|nr:DUF4350 domain-containing protein [Planctomycetales bacterium]
MRPTRDQLRRNLHTGERIHRTLARMRAGIACWLLGALAVVGGCSRGGGIHDTYGQRRGYEGSDSVNGTAVLANLFEQSGYRVFTWQRLSPKLEDADVIVWAPDDFRPPTAEQRDFIEEWLWTEPGRTFVYIGRDFDAASEYWRTIRQGAPPNQAAELARRLAQAQSEHDSRRAVMPSEQYVRWFTLRSNKAPVQVRDLQGPWSAGIDASKTDIRVEARFDIPTLTESVPAEREADKIRVKQNSGTNNAPTNPKAFNMVDYDAATYVGEGDGLDLPDYEPLLYSRDATLVTRITESHWDDSQLIVVTNGSFLLNMPLVNHENRKLAGKLVEACGDGKLAVFVESGPYGIAVYDEEPTAKYPTGLEVFTVWPLAPIALHFAVLGIIVCFCMLPIFGRPIEPELDSISDFGKHIEALGRLLERTRDDKYARTRLRQYYEKVKGEAPAFLVEPEVGPPIRSTPPMPSAPSQSS